MARQKTSESNRGERTKPRAGRFSYEGLDRVMHEKARLGILASLAANSEGLLFNDLKQLCSLTDGNLSRHLTLLCDMGLVDIWKGAKGPRPKTMYQLSANGRRRFAEYISVLEKVVADAQVDARPDAGGRQISGAFAPA